MSTESFLSCRGPRNVAGGLVGKPKGLIPAQAQLLTAGPLLWGVCVGGWYCPPEGLYRTGT